MVDLELSGYLAAPTVISQDNRLTCVGVRFDRSNLGSASRLPWIWDVRKVFSTEDAGRTWRATEQNALRFARSAMNPYSVASTSSPSYSVLRFFLDCGRHSSPRLLDATAGSSDCPVVSCHRLKTPPLRPPAAIQVAVIPVIARGLTNMVGPV